MAIGHKNKDIENSEKTSIELVRELEMHQIEIEMQNEELQRMQGELEAARARYFCLYDLAPVGYFSLSEQGMITEANIKTAVLLGTGRDTLVGQPFSGFVLPEDGDIFHLCCKQIFETGAQQACELRLAKKDNTRFRAQIEAALAKDIEGAPMLNVAMIDITERKKAEEALQESEERYRNMIIHSGEMIQSVAPDGKFIFVNPAWRKTLGYTEKELSNLSMFRIIHPDSLAHCRNMFRKIMSGQSLKGVQAVFVTRDGNPVFVEGNIAPRMAAGQVIATQGFFRNITRRKHMEVKERLAREVLDLLNRPEGPTDTVRDILQAIKTATGFEAVGIRLQEGDDFPYYVTNGFSEKFTLVENTLCVYDKEGKIMRDEKGKAVLDCMCGNIIRGRVDPAMPFFTKGGSFYTNSTTELLASTTEAERQARTRNRCNTEGYESVALIPLRTADRIIGLLQLNDRRRSCFTPGMIRFFEGLSASIGIALSRKQAEMALYQTEENFRRSMDDSPLGVRIVTVEGETIYANKAILDIYGYAGLAELQAVPAKKRYTPESYAEFQIRRENRQQGGFTPPEYEISIVRKDGEIRHLQVIRKEICWNGETQFQAIYRDITEKKRLEAQLLQAQKMESIGTLAGGLAHDFNNLLTGILGNASLAKIELDPSNRVYERLQQIETIVESGANLTRQLLSFARGGELKIITGDLTGIIEKTIAVFGGTRKDITIHKNIAKDLRSVEMDQGQMEQVFMNLLVNAWQAMPGGGDIYISAANACFMEADAKQHSVKPGRHVTVSVTDTGVGMDKKTKARIFEPFFTTREMGRGTGLGLATVYGIVNRHNGFINVYSERGMGTTFTIYLPASEKEARPETSSAQAILGGAETILVVDDEQMNLDVSKDSLELLGYRVYTAANSKEALTLYSEKQTEIDLVILDMIMPGMSGGKVYDCIKEINPDIRCILCSGYSMEGDARKIMEKGCNGFIQKPFTIAALSQEIRKALGG